MDFHYCHVVKTVWVGFFISISNVSLLQIKVWEANNPGDFFLWTQELGFQWVCTFCYFSAWNCKPELLLVKATVHLGSVIKSAIKQCVITPKAELVCWPDLIPAASFYLSPSSADFPRSYGKRHFKKSWGWFRSVYFFCLVQALFFFSNL